MESFWTSTPVDEIAARPAPPHTLIIHANSSKINSTKTSFISSGNLLRGAATYEPLSSAGMMLAGLGLLGAMVRRRKQAQ